jgi:hypothetical protein
MTLGSDTGQDPNLATLTNSGFRTATASFLLAE